MSKKKSVAMITSTVLMAGCLFGCGSADSDAGNKTVGKECNWCTGHRERVAFLSWVCREKECGERKDRLFY